MNEISEMKSYYIEDKLANLLSDVEEMVKNKNFCGYCKYVGSTYCGKKLARYLTDTKNNDVCWKWRGM